MAEHCLEKKIYYHDTDAGGVVYYSRYLDHLEEARTEFFADKGLNLKTLADKDTYFVVARLEMDFKSPAGYLDTLKIFTRVDKIRTSAMQFSQRVMKNDTLVASARLILVCINGNFKPKPVPEEIRLALTEQ